jgi:2-aminoethylphosphonate-pyruvate transaminase
MRRIAERLGKAVETIETPEDMPVSPPSLDRALAADAGITHVAVVHCETTSGILNPVEAVADVCAAHGRALIIDAMSAFGALPIDVHRLRCEAVVASSNKCLEGVPGVGFVIVRREALERAKGSAASLSLDLEDQWRGLEGNGQWRFTPPTHVLAALDQALDEHDAEGGVAGRGGRYRRNHEVLVEGMLAMGFETLVARDLQAPIIVTFRMPAGPAFVFEAFYDRLREKGFVIYPGKLTVAPSFRIGCIGRLGEAEMHGALAAIRETLAEMGVASGAPAVLAETVS